MAKAGNRWPNGPQAAEVDPIPEHTKLAPHMESNWAIRDFLQYLRGRGVQLCLPVPQGTVILTAEQIESAILAFRGVDEAAYRAESKQLMSKYSPTLLASLGLADQQLELVSDDGEDVLSCVDEAADESVIKIIEVLDSLSVPTDAGRRACSVVLMEAGITRPNTALFARAIKVRRAMYGKAIPQPWQFAQAAKQAVPTDRDEAAASVLMDKLNGGSSG